METRFLESRGRTNGNNIHYTSQQPEVVERTTQSSSEGPDIAETTSLMRVHRGKLPITMYPHEYIQQQPLTNYDMSVAPGRTYKYYQGKPLFSFGMGLSLTQFSLDCNNTLVQGATSLDVPPMPSNATLYSAATPSTTTAATATNISVVCTVTNIGENRSEILLVRTARHCFEQQGHRE